MLILSLLLLISLSSCVTRNQIDAVLFVHKSIPQELCDKHPDLKRYGIERVLDCSQELIDVGICQNLNQQVIERISYCKKGITKYFAVKDTDLEAILRKAGIKSN
jgi:hypothetical protein